MSRSHDARPLSQIEIMYVSPLRLGFFYLPVGMLGGLLWFPSTVNPSESLTPVATVLLCAIMVVIGGAVGWVAGLLTAMLINAYTFVFNKGIVVMVRDAAAPASPHEEQLARFSRRSATSREDLAAVSESVAPVDKVSSEQPLDVHDGRV